MRPDDGRRATGYGLLFNKQTETDAWHLARLIKRLSPERRRQVCMLVEAFLFQDEVVGRMEATAEAEVKAVRS